MSIAVDMTLLACIVTHELLRDRSFRFAQRIILLSSSEPECIPSGCSSVYSFTPSEITWKVVSERICIWSPDSYFDGQALVPGNVHTNTSILQLDIFLLLSA